MPGRAERITLPGGEVVALRPIEPSDRRGIAAGFERMSEDSRYRRFMTLAPELTEAQLTYLTEVDHHDHEALIVFDVETADPVGVARFVRAEENPAEAEVAVAVIDDWHGRGVATVLLDRLSARAREEGVERFFAVVLPGNQHALDVFAHFGAVRSGAAEAGLTNLRLELAPAVGEDEPLMQALRAAARGELSGGAGPFTRSG